MCGVQFGSNCRTYSLRTFPNASRAVASEHAVTHDGACGVCSSLQDLGVYMKSPDLVARGKVCATVASIVGFDAGVRCYLALGFTPACAQMWTMDSIHTFRVCRATCLRNLFTPSNVGPTCDINDCIACDEHKSGPIFKLFAGRTRRSSGLRSGIQRNCSEVANIEHRTCAARGLVRTREIF